MFFNDTVINVSKMIIPNHIAIAISVKNITNDQVFSQTEQPLHCGESPFDFTLSATMVIRKKDGALIDNESFHNQVSYMDLTKKRT